MRPEYIDKRPGIEDPPPGEKKRKRKFVFSGPSKHFTDVVMADPRSSEFKARGKKSDVVKFKKEIKTGKRK